VAHFIDLFVKSPRSGEVYNLGGGKENSCSILEAFEICEKHSGISQNYEYLEGNRIGDHICYYSDLTKIKSHYPTFSLRHCLSDTIKQIVEAHKHRS
jgi:CDP-paratose 2-epimerase